MSAGAAPTRRKLLASLTSSTAFASGAPVGAASGDAELLAACAAYHRIAHVIATAHGLPDEEWERIGDVEAAAIERIEKLDAATPAGMRAKVAVALQALLPVHDALSDPKWRDHVTLAEALAIRTLGQLAGKL